MDMIPESPPERNDSDAPTKATLDRLDARLTTIGTRAFTQ